MPNTTPARAKRARVLTLAELDRFAQRAGFPSAQALQRVVELGAHLQSGGKITPDWINRMAEVYPAVPRATLEKYAIRITNLDALADVVGVDRTDARQYVDNHVNNRITADLGARLDQRATARNGGRPLSNREAPTPREA